jgi:hypothetical protein
MITLTRDHGKLTVPDAEQAASDLIALAIHGGAPGNISCLVADVTTLTQP